jgi:hypothetical protein
MKCTIVKLQDESLALQWVCPYCGHTWNFRDADLPTICFLVVHHLSRKHGMNSVQIVVRHPFLEAAVEEYTAPRRGVAGS